MAQTALQTVPTALAPVRDDWGDERIAFIRKTFCGNAPDGIAGTFLEICKRRNLSPEERHIYLTKRGDDWVIQTSIDGYRLIADRSDRYAGSDPPVFEGEGKLQSGKAHPLKATVTVWKLVNDVRCPFTASVFWSEFYPTNPKQAFIWNDKPFHMLGKVGEAHALRKGFPADLSNIYTADEMDQAGPSEPQQHRDSVDQPATPRQLNYVLSVAREAGLSHAAVDEECERLYGVLLPELSRRDASAFIERLQARRAGIEMGMPPERPAARTSATVAAVPTTSDDEDAATEAYAAAMGADLETGDILEADARPSLNHLHGLGAERNLDHGALKVLSLRWFGKESMKDLYADEVSDLEGLVKRFTPEEWPVLLRMVEGTDDTGSGVLMGFAVDLADAKTGKDLKDIFGRMTDGGITDPALMAVGARRKDQLKRLSEMGP